VTESVSPVLFVRRFQRGSGNTRGPEDIEAQRKAPRRLLFGAFARAVRLHRTASTLKLKTTTLLQIACWRFWITAGRSENVLLHQTAA
jgi:hypothetical protein